MDTSTHDRAISVTEELFKQHGGKRLEILAVHLLDDYPALNSIRKTVKLMTPGGDTIELCYELRSSFVKWMVANQISSLQRYDISYVYRRSYDTSRANRYLQERPLLGDFDIVGGARVLSEAKGIKVTKDVLVKFIHPDSCDFHLNHDDLLEALWSWIGIKPDYKMKVSEVLVSMIRMRPQSEERKSRWVVIRHHLLQDHNLPETVVNRLERVSLRFCAPADQALPRLRRALPADKSTRKALDELSKLCKKLRSWKIENNVYIDALMTPIEPYSRQLFFQVYLRKESPRVPTHLLAYGCRYDTLLRRIWRDEDRSSSPPGAVGITIAIETLLEHSDFKLHPLSTAASFKVLVCSEGEGGLLKERINLAAELREAGAQADFVPSSDPSFSKQYEYAKLNKFKCLAIITESEKDIVKVRYLKNETEKDLKNGTEKKVHREEVVRFLLDAMTSQVKKPLRKREQEQERDKDQGEDIYGRGLIVIFVIIVVSFACFF